MSWTLTSASPCFFGFDHLGSQCCTVDPDSVQTHVEDACSLIGKCCIAQIRSFPGASKIRKSKKEEFVSLKDVLDGILRSNKAGNQSALFSEKISEDNIAFLQKKGYVVNNEEGRGNKVSWATPTKASPSVTSVKEGAPVKMDSPAKEHTPVEEDSPVKEIWTNPKDPKEIMERLDKLIDQIDEILPGSSGHGMIGFQINLSEESQQLVKRAFPGYSFVFRGGNRFTYTRLAWPVAEAALPFFQGVAEAIFESPDQGSKKYGMAAMIFEVWMESLADRYKTLDFKLVEKNTGRKVSQVLLWSRKSDPTLKKTWEERIIGIFTKFDMGLTLSQEIARQAKITEEELVELERGSLDINSFTQTLKNIKTRRELINASKEFRAEKI